MKVLILAGGWSSEREISLQGLDAVKNALIEHKHTVTVLDPKVQFDRIIPEGRVHDVALIILHGVPGEDGLFQAMLERIGCPYYGADPAGSILALHKAAAKEIFRAGGILTPKSVFVPVPPLKEGWESQLSYPFFVKPNKGGSSLNVSFVKSTKELEPAMRAIFSIGEEVLIEEAVVGEEISCGVLDEQALPPVLIRSKGSFFDYENKYAVDGAEEICPAPLPELIIQKIQQTAVKAHNILGLRGLSRSDFILCKNGDLFILETNTIPGMTTRSLFPQEASKIGISFPELVEMFLQFAIQNCEKKKWTV